MTTRIARRLMAEAMHALVMLGYWVRPYDMHLDRRRWRWERSGRQRSYAALAPSPALLAAVREHVAAERATRGLDEPTECGGCESALCPDCPR